MEKIGKITLVNADCMDYLKRLPDKCFELAIVDPPYGISIAARNGSIGQKRGQGKITNYASKEWDKVAPDATYFKELFRVSVNQVIFGGNYFVEFLPLSMGWFVWDKRQPEGVTFAQAELAFTSFDRSVKMFSCSRALIGNKCSNNPRKAKGYAKIHPTQKPVAIYKWILKNYAKPGDKILDTHLGSGSICIACDELNFEMTGIELDNDYYEAAKKRLQEYLLQMKLNFIE